MNFKKISAQARRWCGGSLACAALLVIASPEAHANSLYWRRYSPAHIGPGPGFISPAGSLWNGGWWMSVDTGRTPLSICRISDGPLWAYGSFFNGNCNYYSPYLNRAHGVTIGFDLLGGNDFPVWRHISDRRVLRSPIQSFGDPTDFQQQTVLDTELASLCRILQADGAFVGTLRDEVCYAAWNSQTLISSDYEIPEIPQQ
jgi:hypothetical protein